MKELQLLLLPLMSMINSFVKGEPRGKKGETKGLVIVNYNKEYCFKMNKLWMQRALLLKFIIGNDKNVYL